MPLLPTKPELVGTVRTFNKEFRKGMPQLIDDIAKKGSAYLWLRS